MNSFTRSLDQLAASDLLLVGGKGANLGELVRAGLPVPDAICVTTDAYRRHIEANGLAEAIAAHLAGVGYDSPASLGQCSEAIRGLITAAAMPPEVEREVRERFRAMLAAHGDGLLVSVRSSATAEDLPGTSFAGQQDTYLNVRGEDAVVEHVRRCWASLWTDRAIAYRQRQGFAHEDVLLAVVVQEMFPSEVSGVLFTANPVNSNPGQFYLNASWGLGEAIVSGKVNPDQYLVDRRTLEIVEKSVLDKTVMTVRGADGAGSYEAEVPTELRTAQALGDEQIIELCQYALRIEEHFGFYQDIEWGWSNGRFAILQSREITGADLDFAMGMEAWQNPAAREQLDDERWLWSRAYSDEVQTGPSTPLFYTILQGRMTEQKMARFRFTDTTHGLTYQLSPRYEEVPYFRWYGARAYFNLTWEQEQIRMFVPPFARDDALLWRFPESDRERIRRMPFNWIRYAWIIVRLHVTNPRVSLIESTWHLYDNMERWVGEVEATWRKVNTEHATARELLAFMREHGNIPAFSQNCVMPFGVYLFALPAVLRMLLVRWSGDKDGSMFAHLVSGIKSKTSEENLAVAMLARTVRNAPELRSLFAETDVRAIWERLTESEAGKAFRRDLDAFLKLYGHRGGAERDCIHHRWRHKPELVFHSIRPMLSLPDDDDPEAHEEALRQRMLATREKAIERARGRGFFGRGRRAVLRWLIDTYQDYIYYRDFERFHNDKNMSRPRDVYTAVAREFISRGLLTEVEDIFFLGKEEVEDLNAGSLSARDAAIRIRARRRVYDRYNGKEPPKFLRGWTGFNDDLAKDDGMGLRGIAASAGTVTGRARVCRKIEEIGRIKKGDILVTVATDPAWTTVFGMIGAVVVETGGVIAHAVMISREYGIPCVSNLQQACDLIRDGQTITVDGTTGRVILHDDEPA